MASPLNYVLSAKKPKTAGGFFFTPSRPLTLISDGRSVSEGIGFENAIVKVDAEMNHFMLGVLGWGILLHVPGLSAYQS